MLVLPVLLLLAGGWANGACAAGPAAPPEYHWRNGDSSEVLLFYGSVQAGSWNYARQEYTPFDARTKRWGAPAEPPIPPPLDWVKESPGVRDRPPRPDDSDEADRKLFERLRPHFEKMADDRVNARLEKLVGEIETTEFDEAGNPKKGSVVIGALLAGAIAAIVKKVLTAILFGLLVTALWSFLGKWVWLVLLVYVVSVALIARLVQRRS